MAAHIRGYDFGGHPDTIECKHQTRLQARPDNLTFRSVSLTFRPTQPEVPAYAIILAPDVIGPPAILPSIRHFARRRHPPVAIPDKTRASHLDTRFRLTNFIRVVTQINLPYSAHDA